MEEDDGGRRLHDLLAQRSGHALHHGQSGVFAKFLPNRRHLEGWSKNGGRQAAPGAEAKGNDDEDRRSEGRCAAALVWSLEFGVWSLERAVIPTESPTRSGRSGGT